MISKRNQLGLVLNLIILQAGAQSLLDQGSEWHYSLSYFWNADIGVNRCYIDGDTVIEGKECLIYYQEEENCNGRPKKNYLSKEGDQVYFFDSEDATFKLLYDFSLEVGDTMVLEPWSHLGNLPFYIRIDSMGNFRENEVDLKLFHVTYGYQDYEGKIVFPEDINSSVEIIEDIGSTLNFFHFWDNGFCDDQYSKFLRCFSTPDYPTVRFGDIDCLTVPTTDLDDGFGDLEVYPNPFSVALYLKGSMLLKSGRVRLYDISGRIVLERNWPSGIREMEIELEELSPAVYWIEVVSDRGEAKKIFRRKVIKSAE
jgi:hypothetical protein